MKLYYNEWGAGAAMWLRFLMWGGQLREGVVDDRSVTEVKAKEVSRYDRCHWFAGIGGWEEAVEKARWPEGFPLWTASLPCQPFSLGGHKKGHDDERHLWPVFHDLVAQCRPPIIVGEQTSSKAGRAWLAAVRDDLEALGYAVGSADIGAAGSGAPHVRQRLYWVAISNELRSQGSGLTRSLPEVEDPILEPAGIGAVGRVADPGGPGQQRGVPGRADQGWQIQHGRLGRHSADSGPWGGVVYVPCLDGRYRPLPAPGPIEPGAEQVADVLSPLVVPGSGEGLPFDEIDPLFTAEARGMRLKGYGNSISPVVASHFLESVLEVLYA